MASILRRWLIPALLCALASAVPAAAYYIPGGSGSASGGSSAAGMADGGGNARVAPGAAPIYMAETEFVSPAATPTDFAAFAGQSWATTVYLQRVEISCVSTSASAVPVRLMMTDNINSSTGNTVSLNGTPPTDTVHGYTSTPLVGYVTQNSNRNRVAQALIWYWTSNATGRNGVSVGPERTLLDTQAMNCAAGSVTGGLSSVVPTPITFDLTQKGLARGVSIEDASSRMVVVNLNGQALPPGFALNVKWVWTQMENPVIGFFCDSTCAVAFQSFLNGGAVAGGFSKNGGLDANVNVKNISWNGGPLQQTLSETGGASTYWPLSKVLGSGVGNNTLNGTTLQTDASRPNLDGVVISYLINDFRMGVQGVDRDSMVNRGIILLDCAIGAFLNGTTQGQPCTSQYATSYSVAAMTWTGGLATVTTTNPHEYYGGDTSADGHAIPAETAALNGAATTISGSTNPNCNGTFGVAGVNSPTQIVLNMPANPGGACTGPIVEQFAIIWPATLSGNPRMKIAL